MTPALRSIAPGRERLPPRHHMPRHRHAAGYATLVLAGAFEEISYAGRVCAREGDVLLHASFDAHANTMLSNGVWLLRLPWTGDDTNEGAVRVADLDAIQRAARRDVREATNMLREQVARAASAHTSPDDWPDRLAADLSNVPDTRLSAWANLHGLAPETLSRGFRSTFGVTPQRFRWEIRTRRAVHRLLASRESLTEVALDCGFSDHAHMTRSIRALTGFSPVQWRSRHTRSLLY